MYGLSQTKHYSVRTQQRCINRLIADLLIFYGESRRCRDGAQSIFFSRDSLSEIRNDLGGPTCKMCEKYKNAYLIVSDDGALITAARSHGKTIH